MLNNEENIIDDREESVVDDQQNVVLSATRETRILLDGIEYEQEQKLRGN